MLTELISKFESTLGAKDFLGAITEIEDYLPSIVKDKDAVLESLIAHLQSLKSKA